MIQTSFYWPEALADKVRHFALVNGLSMADVMRGAISDKMLEYQPGLQSASDRELVDEVRRRQKGAAV